ncbi:MAG: YheC/YheD family protein [Bacillota bacterium]
MNTGKNSKIDTFISEESTQSQRPGIAGNDSPGQKKSHEKSGKQKKTVIGILTTNRLHRGRIKPYGVQGELSFLSRMGRRVPAEVYVFHPWDIDWKNNRFTGYRFHAEEDGYGHWEKYQMPPPDVVYDQIYNRVAERRYLQDRTRLKKLTNGRYFNPCYLNKHQVHRDLQKVPEIRSHLPEARVLKKSLDLRSMLMSYGCLYIKPVTGSLGHGIIRVTRESGRFVLKTRGGQVRYALSINEIYRKIRAIIGKRLCLVQQGISLITYEGGVVDIRTLMQKDGKGSWTITKVYARVGRKGNITSNLASGGTPHALNRVFSRYFDNERITELKKQIRELSIKVCEAVEETSGYTFGEMGVDLGLDKDGHIWIIEVNSKPRRTVHGKGSPKLITLSFTKPLRFAHYLATKGPAKHSDKQHGRSAR